MKKYLLTIVGNIESKKVCRDIALSISPLVDSPNLKFHHKNGVLMFHFETSVEKIDIYEYIVGILYGTADTFILTELNDNLSVFVPEDVSGHLFDLENVGEDVTMRLDMNRVIKNTDFDEEDDDDFIALLLDEMPNLIKTPTLDQILDKINTKGFESLTPYEQDILENYSKN